ncbi:MAG: site-specific integrase [Christensenellaceae bacterium]|jgi:integrase|nr:site-specific integrase [Christensenellaceae bacterium]
MATIHTRSLKDGTVVYQIQAMVKGKSYNTSWRKPKEMSAHDASRKARAIAINFDNEVHEKAKQEIENKISFNSRKTFAEHANEWLEDSRRKNSPTSYSRNMKIVKDLNSLIGHIPLKTMNPSDCKAVAKFLNGKMLDRPDTAKMIKSFDEVIKTKHICIDDICREFPISTATIYYARHGKNIRWELAEIIAKALGINVSQYFERIKSKTFYSKSSKLIYRRTLFAILNSAVKEEIIGRNPAKNTVSIGDLYGEVPEKKILTQKESDILQNAINNESNIQHKAVIATLFTLGIRKGELLGLQWGDFDFEKRLVSILRSSSYVGAPFHKMVTKEPKTRTSKRRIPIPENLLQIILEYKSWQDMEKLRLKDIWKEGNWVFTRYDGGQLSTRAPSKWLDKMLNQNGLQHVSLHSLRHSVITRLLRAKISPKAVANFCGHSNPNITLSVYAHYMEEDNKDVADILNGMLKSVV